MPKALKSSPESNKLPNLVTLNMMLKFLTWEGCACAMLAAVVVDSEAVASFEDVNVAAMVEDKVTSVISEPAVNVSPEPDVRLKID